MAKPGKGKKRGRGGAASGDDRPGESKGAEKNVAAARGKKRARTGAKPAVSGNWRALVSKGAIPTAVKKRGVPATPVMMGPNNIDWARRDAPSSERTSGLVVALDCEMVGVGNGFESSLARVCVIDEEGRVLLDSYSKPVGKIVDYRTRHSGIRPADLVGAPDFLAVREKVANLIRRKIVVGHSLKNDFSALELKHPIENRRDTANYLPLRKADNMGKMRAVKLRVLAQRELGVSIQDGEHDPYVDARAALELYKKHKEEWERSVAREKELVQKARRHRYRKHTKEDEEDEVNEGAESFAEAGTQEARTADESDVDQAPQGDIFSKERRSSFKRHNRRKH